MLRQGNKTGQRLKTRRPFVHLPHYGTYLPLCLQAPAVPALPPSKGHNTPWLLHSMQGLRPLPPQGLHSTELSLAPITSISSLCRPPGAKACRDLRTLAIIHSRLLPSQVLTMHTKVSPAVLRLSVTWKCRHPSVLSMAVHFEPELARSHSTLPCMPQLHAPTQ